MPDTPRFQAGRNIAMKVPPHQYDATVRFYRDTLGFQTFEIRDAIIHQSCGMIMQTRQCLWH
ncbi:MAG TPA: hypothetical protein DD979_17040 [Gammaproteobacteria bacterium]|jgi:hypothetical protein|nr:hypothetical protein [Gammaproteobacteria bacterium]